MQFSKQKIMPVDCIKIEPYQPPQINALPLKLLMLRGQDELAYGLLGQCLKHLSLFLDVRGIPKLDERTRTRLNLRRKVAQEQGSGCNLNAEPGHRPYDRF